jgi:hypothetical protein
MSYYEKYLKYKNKYIHLKNKLMIGGNDNIEIKEFNAGTLLYHGTFNQISGKINSPGYYSTDPLQSLGHLLSTSTKLCSKDYKPDSEQLIKDLKKISTCYPQVYSYTLTTQIKLLHLLVGASVSNYNTTFGIIFNKDIIKAYLDDIPEKKINILKNFKNKLNSIGIKVSTEEINLDNFNTEYDVLFDEYVRSCEQQCFRGWSNTPGYYILSNIDYNKYLKEVTGIEVDFDGIFVERDQDEIILFNNSKLDEKYNKNYILPYYFYNPDRSLDDAKEFIMDYDEKCEAFLADTKHKNVLAQLNLLEKFKKFSYINSEGTKLWKFDWFSTFCEKFNPYTELNVNEENCPTLFKENLQTNENCTKRYPMNHTNLGIEPDYRYTMCNAPKPEPEISFDPPLLTSKLSILNIVEDSDALQEWLREINKFNELNLDIGKDICKGRQAMLDRVL